MAKYRVYGAKKSSTYQLWDEIDAKNEREAISKARKQKKSLLSRLPKSKRASSMSAKTRKSLNISKWKAEKVTK